MIATKFRDEHRAALEWLNTVSNESQYFFGVRLSVVRIGTSLPAVNFSLEAQPSEIVKAHAPTAAPNARHESYRDFFTSLLERVRAEVPGFTTSTRGRPESWFVFPAGRTGIQFSVEFLRRNQVRAGLYIDCGDQAKNKAYFDMLAEHRAAIESEVEVPLMWERWDDKKASMILRMLSGSIDDPPDKLGELQLAIVDTLRRLRTSFVPRVRALPRLSAVGPTDGPMPADPPPQAGRVEEGD
jgi:hypothetical protein